MASKKAVPLAGHAISSGYHLIVVKDIPVDTANVASRYKTPSVNEAATMASVTKQADADADEITPADEEAEAMMTKYAEMISLEPHDMANYPLYKFIDDWYGTEYRYGGTDTTGIDCSAFSQKLYGDVYQTPILRSSRQQYRHSEHIGEDSTTEGDLVFFRTHRLRITHVGVYLANGYFVHASRSHGVTISSIGDKYWQRRFAGYGRVTKAGRIATESGFSP